jgi:ankyrin repeat protein
MNPAIARGARRRFLRLPAALFALACLPGIAVAGAYDDYFKAVTLDSDSKVADLLKRGFDPNTIEAERGDTGLILALREDSMKVFALLLNTPGVNLEAHARNGDTALMIAAWRGKLDAVRALIAKDAEVNQSGWTALHYAAANGHNDIVALLLENYAYIDAESPNGTTPMMMAARGGHILTVKLLLDEGADATLKNGAGMSAIDFARSGHHDDIADGLTYRLKKAGKL